MGETTVATELLIAALITMFIFGAIFGRRI